MNKTCMKLVCTLIMFIVLAGCEKTVEKGNSSLATDPLADKVTLPPEFASMAIEKAGGLDAWGKVRQLQLDCIVTFYDENAGYYLTDQKYDIFPWSNSIVISGTESQKSYKWQLSQGKFDILKGIGQIDSFKNQMQSNCFAEAILNLVTAPVRFMDKSFVYNRDTNEINIQGKWCYPITRKRISDSNSDVSKNETVFYQNRAASLVDMILLDCTSQAESFLVCGYDYTEIKNVGISIPYRIEIHLADKNGMATRQLFRIDVSSAK